MQKKKIRTLEEMPSEKKLLYFKVLFYMAQIDGDLNQLELMELYMLMAKFKLLQKERLYLLENYQKLLLEDTLDIIKGITSDLEEQEKNILRFSIIKDLIIIMSADYHESQEERDLFDKAKIILDISEEQLKFFQEEYKTDRSFWQEDIPLTISYNRLEERLLTITSVGLPLTVSYIIKTKRPKLKKAFLKESNNNKTLLLKDVIKNLSLGLLTYKGLKYILKIKDSKKVQLKRYLYREYLQIQERAMKYLIIDKNYFHQKLLYMGVGDDEISCVNKRILLLDKALATLKNAKPCLL